jgi:hypothetical protein
MMFRTLLIAVAALIYIAGSSQPQIAQQPPNETDKVSRSSTPSDFPEILNKTKSVALAGIKPVGSTLVNYQFTLQNLSDKNIKAVSINVLSEGHVRIMSMPQDYYGETFIRARESRSLPESLTTSPDPGTYNPPAAREVQIVIESVIFEDGSYEGDLKSAGKFLGGVLGSRLDVGRILPLLDDASSATDAVAAFDALRAQLSSLSYEPEDAEVASLQRALPTLDQAELRASVDAAIHLVRSRLLEKLDAQKQSGGSVRDYNDWLVRTRQFYSKWLLALSGVTLPKPCVNLSI